MKMKNLFKIGKKDQFTRTDITGIHLLILFNEL